ncbi:hypothetical protein [Serinicoccus profundi]|uniref:hypothetical protein n=1 Tax=Serinicoccus profundi TaxID=1078471 RepID=UPI001EE798BF|nr:hypothetical protein [Serinicoccus profundi]
MNAGHRSTTQGVAADHARIAARRSRALVATALRTRSVHAREVLAQAAWGGHTPLDLARWAARPVGAGIPEGADPVGVADHARVLAVQTGDPEDIAVARGLLEQLAASPHWGALRREHVEMLAQLRVLGGDPGARSTSSRTAACDRAWPPQCAPTRCTRGSPPTAGPRARVASGPPPSPPPWAAGAWPPSASPRTARPPTSTP